MWARSMLARNYQGRRLQRAVAEADSPTGHYAGCPVGIGLHRNEDSLPTPRLKRNHLGTVAI